MLEQLKKEVCEANILLAKSNLSVLTWGNVSQTDPTKKYIVIKPSGVPYDLLTAEDMVVCSMSGQVVEGRLAPSVDLPTHMILYRRFPEIKGVCHTHSVFATAFAQARKEIVAMGTTQADTFYGNIPCTEPLSENEIRHDYTMNTGISIVKCFKNIDYKSSPGCLVANHGVFAWGDSARHSVETAIIIEQCAKMNFITLQLDPDAQRISQCLLDEHFSRKHGPNKTYGQKGLIK